MARRGREDRRVQRRPMEREREVELLRIGMAAETGKKLVKQNLKLHTQDQEQDQDHTRTRTRTRTRRIMSIMYN